MTRDELELHCIAQAKGGAGRMDKRYYSEFSATCTTLADCLKLLVQHKGATNDKG